MLERVRLNLLRAVLLAFAVTGCASNTPGLPTTATTPGSSSSTGAASTGISLPPRPKNLSFSGIEPCKLLTAQQQAQLNVNRVLPHAAAPPENEPSCGYEVSAQQPRHTFVIIPSPKVGIQEFLGKIDTSTAKVFSAAGFPAVQSQTPGVANLDCFAEVDVAQGQILTIQVSLKTPQGLTPDELCAKAQQAAGMAVTTLKQLNG